MNRFLMITLCLTVGCSGEAPSTDPAWAARACEGVTFDTWDGWTYEQCHAGLMSHPQLSDDQVFACFVSDLKSVPDRPAFCLDYGNSLVVFGRIRFDAWPYPGRHADQVRKTIVYVKDLPPPIESGRAEVGIEDVPAGFWPSPPTPYGPEVTE